MKKILVIAVSTIIAMVLSSKLSKKLHSGGGVA